MSQAIKSRGMDRHVMTYTNLPADERQPWRIGAHALDYHDGERFHLDPSTGALLGPDGVQNKDAVLWNLTDGRVAFLHRIHPTSRSRSSMISTTSGMPIRTTGTGILPISMRTRSSDPPPVPGRRCGRPADEVGRRAVVVLPRAARRRRVHDEPGPARRTNGSADHRAARGAPGAGTELGSRRRRRRRRVRQGAHLKPTATRSTSSYGAADRHVGAATASVSHLVDLLLR